MSKNFELLTQADPRIAIPPSPGVLCPHSEVKPTEEAPSAAAALPRGELVRGEVAKLAHRIFHLPKDGTALRAVMFCGIEHGDGTSWISAQVARMVAAQGIGTVCAVDTNLRLPTLHTYFQVSNRVGLADALRRVGPLRSFVQAGTASNLWILPSGDNAEAYPLPARERLRDRIAELRAEFDYLIFDAPPVAHSSEAITVGGILDGVVMVVGAYSTRRATALKAKEILEAAQVRLLGTVLNRRAFPIPASLYRRL